MLRAEVTSYRGADIDKERFDTLCENALLPDDVLTRVKSVTDADTPYSMDPTDVVLLVDAAGLGMVVEPPSADVVSGRHFWIKKIEAGANTITINPVGAQTIDGSATHVFGALARSARHIYSDGTNWHILGSM